MTEKNKNDNSAVSTKLSPRQEKSLENALDNQQHKVVNVVEIIANEDRKSTRLNSSH